MRDLPLPTLPLAGLHRPRDRPPITPLAAAPERSAGHASPGFEVLWARHQDDVRLAQQLRHEVFAGELGARLTLPAGTPPGHDADLFDPYCEHLLVRTPPRGDDPGRVVGTYRLLTPAAARRVGGLYTETEFDLMRLRPLRARMAEVGRSCVHPAWRSGGVILALWGALAEFMAHNGLETMVGCASIGMRDGGHYAASLWQQLRGAHMAPLELQARPRLPLPVEDLRHDLDVEAPPLIKGYLRLGAKLLGAPAWDPDFNTADLPMLMRLEDMPARYRRHFLGD